jgi:hypothetical protein
MEILQIVPRLPPSVSGVGDYAYLLANQLRAAHDIHTRFIVCGQGARSEGHGAEGRGQKADVRFPASDFRIDGFPVYHLKERSAGELLRVLSQPGMPQTVLLQYVGYGYEKRGCPVWLVKGLRAWSKAQSPMRQAPSAKRLITMFHELYAFGPPWRSSFWTSPLQRQLATQLARLSDACVTNMRRYANWLGLRARQHAGQIKALAVFSNVGEPAQVPAYHERPPRLAVFGTPSWRRQAYTKHRDSLVRICKSLELTEIVDIGAPCEETPNVSIRCVQKGSLPAELVSQELLSCRAGFFAYPIPYLGKSGSFAAYAAHGLAPVTHSANPVESEDGIHVRDHYLPASILGHCDAKLLEIVCSKTRDWYAAHDLRKNALSYADALRQGDQQ